VKRRVHDPIVDPPQEDEVMGRALQWGHEHGVDPEDVRAIMTRVIAMCRGVQSKSS
jgi:chorismate mutase